MLDRYSWPAYVADMVAFCHEVGVVVVPGGLYSTVCAMFIGRLVAQVETRLPLSTRVMQLPELPGRSHFDGGDDGM